MPRAEKVALYDAVVASAKEDAAYRTMSAGEWASYRLKLMDELGVTADILARNNPLMEMIARGGAVNPLKELAAKGRLTR